MKNLIVFVLFVFMFSPALVTAQGERISKSSLTGISLPLNTFKPVDPVKLTPLIGRMDSLFSRNSLKLNKSSVELFQTNADSLFNRLNKDGWNIKPIHNQSIYELKKENNKYLMIISKDKNLLPGDQQSISTLSSIAWSRI